MPELLVKVTTLGHKDSDAVILDFPVSFKTGNPTCADGGCENTALASLTETPLDLLPFAL